MSVINQVLNDIEQRKNNAHALDPNKFLAIELKEPRFKVAILLAVLIVVSALIAIIWWQFGHWSMLAQNQPIKPTKTELVISATSGTVADFGDVTEAKADLSTESGSEKLAIKALDVDDKASKKMAAASKKAAAVAIKVAIPEQTSLNKKQQNIGTKIPGTFARVAASKAQQTSETKGLSIEAVELTSKEIAALRFRQGIEQQDKGYLFKAQDLWRESLVVLPSYHQARERLVFSHLDTNNIEQALALLIEGIKLFPAYQQYQLLAAKVYLHNQQPEQALLLLDRPYRFNDKSSELIAFAAAIAQQLQLWRQAELNYDALVSREKNNEKWLMGLAIALDAQGKVQPAITRYSQLILLSDISSVLFDYAQRRIVLLQPQQRVNNG